MEPRANKANLAEEKFGTLERKFASLNHKLDNVIHRLSDSTVDRRRTAALAGTSSVLKLDKDTAEKEFEFLRKTLTQTTTPSELRIDPGCPNTVTSIPARDACALIDDAAHYAEVVLQASQTATTLEELRRNVTLCASLQLKLLGSKKEAAIVAAANGPFYGFEVPPYVMDANNQVVQEQPKGVDSPTRRLVEDAIKSGSPTAMGPAGDAPIPSAPPEEIHTEEQVQNPEEFAVDQEIDLLPECEQDILKDRPSLNEDATADDVIDETQREELHEERPDEQAPEAPATEPCEAKEDESMTDSAADEARADPGKPIAEADEQEEQQNCAHSSVNTTPSSTDEWELPRVHESKGLKKDVFCIMSRIKCNPCGSARSYGPQEQKMILNATFELFNLINSSETNRVSKVDVKDLVDAILEFGRLDESAVGCNIDEILMNDEIGVFEFSVIVNQLLDKVQPSTDLAETAHAVESTDEPTEQSSTEKEVDGVGVAEENDVTALPISVDEDEEIERVDHLVEEDSGDLIEPVNTEDSCVIEIQLGDEHHESLEPDTQLNDADTESHGDQGSPTKEQDGTAPNTTDAMDDWQQGAEVLDTCAAEMNVLEVEATEVFTVEAELATEATEADEFVDALGISTDADNANETASIDTVVPIDSSFLAPIDQDLGPDDEGPTVVGSEIPTDDTRPASPSEKIDSLEIVVAASPVLAAGDDAADDSNEQDEPPTETWASQVEDELNEKGRDRFDENMPVEAKQLTEAGIGDVGIEVD